MVQSLKLGGAPEDQARPIRRINRLPILIVIVLVVAFLGVIFYGLTSRGLYTRGNTNPAPTSGAPASTYADQLTRGIGDAIIGEPAPVTALPPQPPSDTKPSPASNPFAAQPKPPEPQNAAGLEPEEIWRARLKREQEEQYLREYHRR